MKKVLIFLVFFTACAVDAVEEVPEIQETTTSIVITTTTTSTTTTSTTTTSTTTAVNTSTLPDAMPTVLITCEPTESNEEGLMTFNFEVTTGTNELVVLNIVSWFDSSRTDDLFISDGLPEPGNSKEFGYTVDSSFSQYEIEMVVMESKDNFANDYCLYQNLQNSNNIPDNPGDSKNCGDFSDYAEAKAWFDTYYEYYGDVAKLDSDDDLEPCESLPGGP